MALATVLTLADLARAAQAAAGPLGPPVKAGGPALDAAGLREVVQIGTADIKRRFATGTAPDGTRWRPLRYNRPSGAGQPLRDTGRLMASIAGRVEPGRVVWFTARPGAALQNEGGTVVPRKGKFLAIPLTRQAQRAGSPRKMRGTPGAPLFARRVNGRLVGHFLLVKKAVVPARPFMGLSEAARAAIASAAAEAAARRWRAGGGP
jgi:phage gpG-like protein